MLQTDKQEKFTSAVCPDLRVSNFPGKPSATRENVNRIPFSFVCALLKHTPYVTKRFFFHGKLGENLKDSDDGILQQAWYSGQCPTS